MTNHSIESIIERSHVWVFDYQSDKGYGTNTKYTRLPPEFGYVQKWDDAPWTTTIGPYVLGGDGKGGRAKEKIERIYKKGDSSWKTLEEVSRTHSNFPTHVYRDEVTNFALVINHGRLPNTGWFYIARHFLSKRSDESGRGGLAYVKALILTEQDHRALVNFIRYDPANVEEVFGKIAAKLDEKNRLPGETKEFILVTESEF